MAQIMNNWIHTDLRSSRKRMAFDDPDEDMFINQNGKRLRLDNVFEDLSLTESTKRQKSQLALDSEAPASFSNVSFVPPSDLNAYIASKIRDEFVSEHQKNNQVIHKYDSRRLVWVRFQWWVLRLFNRFILKYNRNNNAKVPKFKNFFKLVVVLESPEYNLTYNDLMGIVMREAGMEMAAVEARLSKPKSVLEEIEEESFTYNDVKYGYWDTIGGLEDVEMETEESGDEYDRQRYDIQGHEFAKDGSFVNGTEDSDDMQL